MKTPPGPKELAQRELQANRHLSKNGRVLDGPAPKKKRSLIPYAGKPPGTSNEHLYGNTPGPKPPKGGQRKKPK